MGSIFQSFHQSKQRLPVSQRPADSISKYSGINNNANHHDKDNNKEEQGGQGAIRRRLSSLSLKIQLQPANIMKIPPSSPAAASWGALRRSKSVSEYDEYGGGSINDSIRKWWDWGWAWILSRKPTFARDLEMNEAETAALGCHNKGSWRHVFYKVKSELGRFVGGWGSSDNMGLPQTFRPQL